METDAERGGRRDGEQQRRDYQHGVVVSSGGATISSGADDARLLISFDGQSCSRILTEICSAQPQAPIH